ncbi:hypothetical protein [Rossellomorea arthrocnemi]|nr:hypothetical protein [Rossellomorea arthrocnemi]
MFSMAATPTAANTTIYSMQFQTESQKIPYATYYYVAIAYVVSDSFTD